MKEHNSLSEFMQENYLAIVSQSSDLDDTFKQGIPIVEEAVEELNGIGMDRILLTGCGDSLFVSEICRFAFEEFVEMPTEAIPALELARYRKLGGNDLVIASSASGRTSRTIEAVKRAKSQGAYVVSITNDVSGILAQLSDWILLTRCSPPIGILPSKTSTTALLLLFMLAVRIANRLHRINGSRSEQLMEQLGSIPSIVKTCIRQNEARVKEAASALRNCENFHFIGGGPSLGVAKLGSAKIKELSLGHAEAVELEEFCHYQILIVSKDTPAILVLPPGASYDRGLDVLDGLGEIGARAVIVSDADDEFIRRNAFTTFEIEGDVSEVFSSIPYVIPLQLFAYHLAIQKGRNPGWFREPNASAIRISE
ncbi:MAG: SIS domain-containing protein [Candidatus Hodarchaeota archaeon]